MEGEEGRKLGAKDGRRGRKEVIGAKDGRIGRKEIRS